MGVSEDDRSHPWDESSVSSTIILSLSIQDFSLRNSTRFAYDPIVDKECRKGCKIPVAIDKQKHNEAKSRQLIVLHRPNEEKIVDTMKDELCNKRAVYMTRSLDFQCLLETAS